jgi:hypothetical protein
MTMTEQEWLACTDPVRVVTFLRAGRWWRRFLPDHLDSRRFNARKMRLLACGWERGFYKRLTKRIDIWETSERYADGAATLDELLNLSHDGDGVPLFTMLVGEVLPTFNFWERMYRKYPPVLSDWASEAARMCLLLRCIFNPFCRVTTTNHWLAWNNGTVPKIAQAIYDARAFHRLPVLADALEDAGCDNADILGHCRQPSDHVRGCWVVDLLLGKE